MTLQRKLPLKPFYKDTAPKPVKREPKPKRCKVCRAEFKPRTPLESTCSIACNIENGKKVVSVKKSKLKSKQRAVTAAEKAMWSKLAALGCVACRKDGRYNPHVSIHHVDGRTKEGCHTLVLPLCGSHHQDDGTGAIAVHPWKAQFEARYGDQRELVRECMKMIGEADESSKD